MIEGLWNDTRGRISYFELMLIAVIVMMVCFVIGLGVSWCGKEVAHGNDSLLAETAEKEALVNSSNGSECVVNDCPSKNGGICTHQEADGTTIGYLDKTTKQIVGGKPEGYNEYTEMNIGDQSYFGEIGSMVIQIKAGANGITVDWVPGRND